MTLLVTTSDLDVMTRLHHDADELARKLRAEHVDLLIRAALLESQIAKLDAITRSLDTMAKALAAAKPDALRVVPRVPGLREEGAQ